MTVRIKSFSPGRNLAILPRIIKLSTATLFNRTRSKGYEVVIILPGHTLGLFEGEEEDGEQ